MTQSKPVLEVYGPLHALSSRGLHVRQSTRSWKLIVPMAPELLELVRALCQRAPEADAASLLELLDWYMRNQAELRRAGLPGAVREFAASLRQQQQLRPDAKTA